MSSIFTGPHSRPRDLVRALLVYSCGILFVLAFPAGLASAQEKATAWVRVSVTDRERHPVENALVGTQGSHVQAPLGITRSDGVVLLGPLHAGSVTLTVRRLGFVDATPTVQLIAGDTVRLDVLLDASVQALGTMRVVSLRGDQTPSRTIGREQVAAGIPHDAADVLRVLPGTDAMRRGALGFDPVVRGLRDTQLGVYVDAARTFPGGPAGMDTPLSHVDPAHVQTMEVVSGPYALTWGAGNLSAVRVTTDALPGATARSIAGRVSSGYDGNLGAQEHAASLTGALGPEGRVQYATSGAWRSGGDYRDGDGRVVAGGFTSREARAKLGVRVGAGGMLSVLAAKQEQRDIDYPGRPLDAAYFDSHHLQGEYVWKDTGPRRTSRWRPREASLMGYVYDVDHLMDNDDKPTALANPNRTPPFPLRINTWSGVRVTGGRAMVGMEMAGVRWLAGGDVFRADHDARRQTDRRDNGVLVRRDLIWGGAHITDAGGYVRGERDVGRTTLTATVRADVVRANADSASAFFVQQNGADLSSREFNWSGAATLRIPLSVRWSLTAGLGSVVRTAEANERFSDRAAAKRAQTNAEFLGSPTLAPERSTQADLWLEGHVSRLHVQVNAFTRSMTDYITIAPTSLPRAQAGSPPPVFRFVNGRAVYHGGEIITTSAVTSALSLDGSLSYLYGDDRTLTEPALGVTPLRGALRARLAPARVRWFMESTLHAAGRQSRVALTRGERSTSGWTTVDMQGGYQLGRGLSLRGGVRNLLDRAYVQHLTALDAFTAGRIAEPGRVWFTRLSVAW